MTASFTLVLDTAPPVNPGLLLNGGATVTGAREVTVTLSSADYLTGSRDVTWMRLWGDVDPLGDPQVHPLEADSGWLPFDPDYAVRLSDGSGRKTVRARLRDDVCNDTVEFSAFIDLDLTSPVVQMVTAVDRSRISKVAPCATALFTWQSTRPFDRYEVRVVPNIGSPHGAGVVIGTAHGSANTTGVGAFEALVPMPTTIHGADLEIASPGDTVKVIKVFVRDLDGVWSA